MQVSRTDANVLFELDPQDLEVIQQMNYSSVIPEVQVGCSTSCLIFQSLLHKLQVQLQLTMEATPAATSLLSRLCSSLPLLTFNVVMRYVTESCSHLVLYIVNIACWGNVQHPVKMAS